jgi:AraC-like DNA-binding protein
MSDQYENIYPRFLCYETLNAHEWYDVVFQENDSIRFLPVQKISIANAIGSASLFITCLINNSQYGFINPSGILACVLNADGILDEMLYQDQQSSVFLYISDKDKQIIMTHNYPLSEPLDINDQTKNVKISTQDYMIIRSFSHKLGLEVVAGIPERLFRQNVNALIQLLLVYIITGTILIFLLTFIFSLKESLSFNQLIERISYSSNSKFTAKNEYIYLFDAIKEISSCNEKLQRNIETLSHSMKACLIENLFLYGIFAHKDESEIITFMDQDFRRFCIVIIHFQTSTQDSAIQPLQQSILLNVENIITSTLTNEFITLNNNRNESVILLSFEKFAQSSADVLRKKLSELYNCIESESQWPLTIYIGMSDVHTGVNHVRQAYLQARDNLYIILNNDINGSYLYQTSRVISGKKVLDISLLINLYDFILCGDKNSIEHIFADILRTIQSLLLKEHEAIQIFFSLRQIVYNACVELSTSLHSRSDQARIYLPDYSPLDSIDLAFRRLLEATLTLCEIITEHKRNSNVKLKEKIITFIHQNYFNSNLSANLISREFLLSEKYIFSLVKEHTGKSLSRYIEDTRVMHAEKILISSNKSNAEISCLCGFGSENTFYRAFSKRHGVSPSNWKKIKINGLNTDAI